MLPWLLHCKISSYKPGSFFSAAHIPLVLLKCLTTFALTFSCHGEYRCGHSRAKAHQRQVNRVETQWRKANLESRQMNYDVFTQFYLVWATAWARATQCTLILREPFTHCFPGVISWWDIMNAADMTHIQISHNQLNQLAMAVFTNFLASGNPFHIWLPRI